MTITNNQLKLLWVAQKKTGVSEKVFRTVLVQVAGVTSVKDLDSDGFAAVLGFFEYLGFRPMVPNGESYGERPGMASSAQIELIRSLWAEYGRDIDIHDDDLNFWLERHWGISSLRFLRSDIAPKVIGALRTMVKRSA